MIPNLLALATLTFTPVIQFTSDSVYTKDSILGVSILENYDEKGTTLVSTDLVLSEKHLLGYTIYDNKDTDYIDGLKVDGEFVTGWTVENFDTSVTHYIQIKTVYTDDAAGMLMAAKDGDWTKLLSNPLIILQLGYYLLAAISIVVGGFGLVKSKKKKIKDHNQIAALVSEQAISAKEDLVATTVALITPLFEKLGTQNSSIIKALIMSKSKDDSDTLALLDLLKDAQSGEDLSALIERIKTEATEAFNKKLTEQKEAKATIEAIANGTHSTDSENSDSEGGVAI